MAALLGIALVVLVLLALLGGLWWSWRHPYIGLGLIVAGMAFHSFLLMVLLRLGTPHALVRIAQAWKEVLIAALSALAVALLWRRKRDASLGALVLADWVAIVFATLIVIYVLLPSSVLHSSVTVTQRLLGFRIAALIPLMYFFGRWLGATDERERLTVAWLCLGAGAVVAVFGLFELWFVPTRIWLDWGVNLYTGFLGFTYHGPGGLPENFFLTLPDGRLVRRMVSSYISPLGIAYTGLLLFPLGVVLVDRYRAVTSARWLSVAALTLLMIGVMLSLTRLALVATIGEAFLLFLLLRRPWIAAVVPVLIAATGLMLFAYPLIGPSVDTNLQTVRLTQSQRVVSPSAKSPTVTLSNAVSPATVSPIPASPVPITQSDTSFVEHYAALVVDFNLVRQHPFGVGIGGSVARYGTVAGTGESAVLGMFGDMGLLGGAVYVAFYLLALWNGFRAYRSAPKDRPRRDDANRRISRRICSHSNHSHE